MHQVGFDTSICVPPSSVAAACYHICRTHKLVVALGLFFVVECSSALCCKLQTAIQADGFRSLADGEPVEFVVENGNDDRPRAIQVSGPDGRNVQVGCGECFCAHDTSGVSLTCTLKS